MGIHMTCIGENKKVLVFTIVVAILFLCLATGCNNYDIDDFEPGQVFTLGYYEQDNNLLNGKEPIEWIVVSVDRDEKKVLLISKYILDCKPFNDISDLNKRFADEDGNLHLANVDVTWEDSTLRQWLNDDFIGVAFDQKEQQIIADTQLESVKNPEWYTISGNPTVDKAFLLSLDILADEKYGFNSLYYEEDKKRKSILTQYAQSKTIDFGVEKLEEDGTKAGSWWIRLTGHHGYEACTVNIDGSINLNGRDIDSDSSVGVRPAIWIDLNS